MPDEAKEFVARASLDNLNLLVDKEELIFSDFFISKSPNCIRDITITKEDGTESIVPHSPDEDEYEPGFPRCTYYLELELGKNKPFAFDEAQRKLIWALDRLRLFKPGSLWGELYGIFAPEKHPVGAFEVRRSHEEGPYPLNYHALKNVPTDSFAVALNRFHLYFDRDFIQDRAIDLMVALESMFSDDAQAIAYKIALRAACLIESDAHKRKDLFNFLKKAYNERNPIVHGRDSGSWFEEKTYTPAQTNLDSLEEVVRRSIFLLLRNAQNGLILKPSDLDGYLFFDQESH